MKSLCNQLFAIVIFCFMASQFCDATNRNADKYVICEIIGTCEQIKIGGRNIVVGDTISESDGKPEFNGKQIVRVREVGTNVTKHFSSADVPKHTKVQSVKELIRPTETRGNEKNASQYIYLIDSLKLHIGFVECPPYNVEVSYKNERKDLRVIKVPYENDTISLTDTMFFDLKVGSRTPIAIICTDGVHDVLVNDKMQLIYFPRDGKY